MCLLVSEPRPHWKSPLDYQHSMKSNQYFVLLIAVSFPINRATTLTDFACPVKNSVSMRYGTYTQLNQSHQKYCPAIIAHRLANSHDSSVLWAKFQ